MSTSVRTCFFKTFDSYSSLKPFYQCVTYGFYTEEWQEQVYTIFSLLTMYEHFLKHHYD
jgi:hypothetical protein